MLDYPPVAARSVVVSHQSAHAGIGPAIGRPQGVGGADGAVVVARQPADLHVRAAVTDAPDVDRRPDPAQRPGPVVGSHQSAHVGILGNDGACGVAGADAAFVLACQGAHVPEAVDLHAGQAQVTHHPADAHVAQQAHVVGAGAVDVQVGDGVAAAVDDGGELVAAIPDGFPACAVVVVGIVGAVAGGAGVEVQVRGQLVAAAPVALGAGGAAGHGEGRRVVGAVGRVVGHAVAVQVVADGVELGQGAYLDQAVAVAVVVGGRRGRFRLRPGPCGYHQVDGQGHRQQANDQEQPQRPDTASAAGHRFVLRRKS